MTSSRSDATANNREQIARPAASPVRIPRVRSSAMRVSLTPSQISAAIQACRKDTIIFEHNGSIYINDRPGGGTIVTIELPLNGVDRGSIEQDNQ